MPSPISPMASSSPSRRAITVPLLPIKEVWRRNVDGKKKADDQPGPSALYATPDYGRGSFESESEATRLRLVRHLIDRDRDRENRHVILARRDFHRVRVCDPQPLLRDLRD